jgi:hypothetical protein
VANASANRLGRTQNPMPARVMKKTGRGYVFQTCGIRRRLSQRPIRRSSDLNQVPRLRGTVRATPEGSHRRALLFAVTPRA